MTTADELLKQWLDEVGECTCDPAYRDRGLSDPNCLYHEFDYLIEETKKYLEATESDAILAARVEES